MQQSQVKVSVWKNLNGLYSTPAQRKKKRVKRKNGESAESLVDDSINRLSANDWEIED